MLADTSVVCPILIGRHVPLGTGTDALERAHASHGGALLVSGEAGIGKSRLVRALVEQARELGFVTLTGACFEADRAHPYAPILDLVRVLASVASPSIAAHYFAAASADLVTLFPELQSIFADSKPRRTLGPEEDRRRLFQSFSEAVRAIARVQPLLLVIEDVHWSDDATLDLVLHLARHMSSQRITLILTFRSDETGPRLTKLLADLDRARCAAEILLRPLDVADISAMLHAIFGSQAVVDTSFVSGLHALTEGNPFFVEEMLKALVMAGDIARADGVWRAKPLEQVRVPRTATEAVGRRLAGLSAEARRVASVAAVAGRRFDFGLLQSLTQHDEGTLLSLVKELIDAQLVVEESEDRFAFRHALTRESMRSQLLLRERVAWHKAIATALEARFDDTTHDLDDDLAYHTFECGAWDAARRHARRAAEHAWTLCAPRAALQLFDRAVTATARAGQSPEPALLAARGRAHEMLGAFQQAHEDFTAALDAARGLGDRNSAWVALHALGMLWAARDYERAGEYRRDALALARALDDPMLVARSLNRVGNWYVNREDPQSGIPYHEEALGIFERAGELHGVAETLDLLAMAHHIAGDEERAVALYERAIRLFTELGDRRALANAFAVLVVCGPSHHASAGAVCTSSHAADMQQHERAVRLAVEIGWRAGEAFARYLLADSLSWRGEYERALRLAHESLLISEELEHLEWQCGARRVLGVTALDLSDTAEALMQLETSYRLAQRLGSATWIRWTGAPYAIALARVGRAREASAVVDDIDHLLATGNATATGSHRDRRTLGARYVALASAEAALAAGDPTRALELVLEEDTTGTPRAALLRAQALAALHRWDEATAALSSARTQSERQGALPLLWRVDALQGAVHLGQRQRLDARRCFDAARETASRLALSLSDAALAEVFRAGVDALAPPPAPRTARQAAKAALGGLTKREREAAALIAAGKSNRDIARTLGIGERTVEGYVAAAMAKLGATSRAQVAVWAVEQGLAPASPAAARCHR